jgi:putative SOS response-associated peptidase YedK
MYAMSGLWQERNGVRQFTNVTTKQNDVVKGFHHRMPVVLAKADYDRWLDSKTPIGELLLLLNPWAEKLTATEAPKSGERRTVET